MEFDIDERDSNGNMFLLSPLTNSVLRKKILEIWKEVDLSDHVFIASSGTSNTEWVKTYALSFKSLRNNAVAVNCFLKVTKNDLWFASLPHYHVGGLSIHLRAQEAGILVKSYKMKWNVNLFYKELCDAQATLTSLVPTQLYDLVSAGLSAPKGLRAVFVGGDFLATELKAMALDLGWPIVLTYGMTEACSQIASSFAVNSPQGYLQLLPIHSLNTDGESFSLQSSSLYTLELMYNSKTGEIVENRCEGTLLLPDKLSIKDGLVKPLGRIGDEVKISGRLVSLLEIRNLAEKVFIDFGVYKFAKIETIKDERLGAELVLILDQKYEKAHLLLLDKLNSLFDGPIKITSTRLVDSLEKTELGKMKRN